MSRIPPSQQIQQRIHQLLARGLTGEGSVVTELLTLGAQRVVQELLEQEVTAFLGREHYRRGPRRIRGYRNGYRVKRVPAAEGAIPVHVPQVRDTAEPFESRLLTFLTGHRDVLQRLVTEMYARGLSTRDIEEAFTDATGARLLTKSQVSELTETLWSDFEAFQARDLRPFPVEYLFLDAVFEPIRRTGRTREGVLAAWGICRDGRRVLLHLALGNTESYENWREFLRDLVKRGMRTPTTVTSDGAPGLIRAIDQVWPQSLRIRCWAHKARNVLDKVPDAARAEVKAHLAQIREAATLADGQQAVQRFRDTFGALYPSALKSLEDDLEASLNHLRVPAAHRKFVRTTNLLERTFEEERRRTKVIPRFWTEHSALKLIFGTLDRASRRWQRITISEIEIKHMDQLRQELGLEVSDDCKTKQTGEISSGVA
jgi:putative transposase